MKKITVFLLLVFATILESKAQITAQIGSDSLTTTTLYSPFYRFGATSATRWSLANIVYTQAELAAVGITSGVVISSLEFNKANSGASTSPFLFQMKMANSTTLPPLATSTTWGSIIASHTDVFNDPTYSLPATIGWIPFVLQTPFIYTGGSLEIATYSDFGSSPANTTTAAVQWYHSPGTATFAIGQVGSTNPPAATQTLAGATVAYKHRPNIRIVYSPSPPCTSPPVVATVNTNINNLCLGQNFNLTLDSISFGVGQTYQWEISPDSINWSPIPNETNPFYSGTQTVAEAFYRNVVTCSGISTPSKGIKIIYNVNQLSGVYVIDSTQATAPGVFTSIDEAVEALNCVGLSGPVDFQLVSGTYAGNFSIINVPNPNNFNISFTSVDANADSVIIIPLDPSTLFTINDVTNLSFGNITFRRTEPSTTAQDLIFATGTTGLSIFSCKFEGTTGSVSSANRLLHLVNTAGTFVSNSIFKDGYYGIHGPSVTGTSNNSLTISQCTFLDIYFTSFNLVGTNNNVLIEDNLINNSTTVSTTATGMTLTNHDNLVVRRNTILGNLGTSVFALNNMNGSASAPNLFYNNVADVVCSGTVPRAMILTAATTNGLDYLELVHNSFNMAVSTTSTTQNGVYYITGGTPTAPALNGVRIQNNILSILSTNATNTVPANLRSFYIGNIYVLDNNLLISNNNIIHNPSAVNFAYIAAPTPVVTVSTIANWQSTYGLDSASLTVDPQFIGSGNLALLPLSPANGLGVPISYVTTDINGTLRSTTNPDAGAFELVVNQNDIALDSIISPSGAISAGLPTPITVRLVNFGTATLTSLSVNYQFASEPVVTETFTGSLAFLDTTIFTFATNLTVPGSANNTNLVVWVSNPNGQPDQNTANDTITQSLCIAIQAGTYSVGNTTSDFPDFNDFLTRLNCGGVSGPVVFNFDFPNGELIQQVVIGSIPGASATNTVVFNGNTQIISFAPVTADRAVMRLDGTQYLEIRNFHIRSTVTGFGFGIQLLNNASNNKIVGNHIDLSAVTSATAAASGGIVSAALLNTNITPTIANNNLVDSNLITGGFYGIRLNGTAGSTNTSYGNIISNNIITNFRSHGVYLLGTDSTIVKGNIINRLTQTANVLFYGVNLEAGNQNVIVDGNRIHDSHTSAATITTAAYGVRITTSSPSPSQSNKVFNNIIYNLNPNAITNGLLFINSANIEAYYNTISLDNILATSGEARGIYYQGTVSNMTARNNNISITKGGTGAKQGIFIETLASTVNSNFNNIYVNSQGTGLQAIGNYGGGTNNFITLADWQGAGFDSSSFATDPQFADLVGLDFTPQSAVLNGTATPISFITTDFFGVIRDATNPDIGAIEFTPSNIDVAAGNLFELQNGLSTSITSGCVSSLSKTIQLEIINVGLDTVNSVTVNYRLNSGAVTTETVNGPFVTGTTTLYTFNAPVVFTGNLDTLAVWISNAGDLNRSNDTSRVQVQFQQTPFVIVPYINNFESPTDLSTLCTSVGPNSKLEILGTVGGNNLAINGNSSLVFSGTSAGTPWTIPTAANWDVLNPNSNVSVNIFVRADTLSRLTMKFRLQQLYRLSAVSNNFRVLINDVPVTPIGFFGPDFRPANAAASSDTLDLEYNLDAFVGDTVKITFLASVRYDYTGSPLNATIIDGLQIFQPTQPGIDSVTIALNECTPTSKNISAEVNFVFPASTVELNYQVNNAAYLIVPMTLNVGTGFYNGTIPAQSPNDTVNYFIRATDNQNNITNSDTLSYVDDYIVLSAGPDQTIVSGSSATLIASSNIGGGSLLISEIMYYRGAGANGGQQANYPAFLPLAAADDDFFEITNTGGSPISLAGKKFSVVYNTTQLDLIFPVGAVLAGNSVAIVMPGQGVANIANNLYFMGGTSNNVFLSSANPGAFVLYDENNNILDVMKYNANPFPAALGVSASDWTGSLTGSATYAAFIRSGEDTNDASDWSLSGTSNLTSIGFVNPTLTMTNASAVEWFNLAGTSLGTGDTLVVSPTITTSYVAVVTDGNCTKRDTVVVTVSSNQVVDATIESIITPVTGVAVNASVPVKVVVRNVGTLPISGGFDLVYTINGVTSSQQGFGNTIAVGDTAQLTFNTPWLPTQGGNYELCVRAIVPNDVNANNDTLCANFTSSVSVNNIAGNSFKVYPNPATDFVVLEFNDPLFGTTSIQIFDIAGRLQQQNIVTESTNRFEIRLSDLQEGIYQVRIINSLGTSTSQLFIRK